MERNLALVAARRGVDAARAQRLVASSLPPPQVTVGNTSGPVHGDLGRQAARRAVPIARPTMSRSGSRCWWSAARKRELRTRVAEQQIEAAEAQVLDTLRIQLFQLRQAFLGALLARANLEVALGNRAALDRTEALLRRQIARRRGSGKRPAALPGQPPALRGRRHVQRPGLRRRRGGRGGAADRRPGRVPAGRRADSGARHRPVAAWRAQAAAAGPARTRRDAARTGQRAHGGADRPVARRLRPPRPLRPGAGARHRAGRAGRRGGEPGRRGGRRAPSGCGERQPAPGRGRRGSAMSP